MFVVVSIASGLFGEREKKLWKRAQSSRERASYADLACVQTPPTPSPQENRLRGPAT